MVFIISYPIGNELPDSKLLFKILTVAFDGVSGLNPNRMSSLTLGRIQLLVMDRVGVPMPLGRRDCVVATIFKRIAIY